MSPLSIGSIGRGIKAFGALASLIVFVPRVVRAANEAPVPVAASVAPDASSSTEEVSCLLRTQRPKEQIFLSSNRARAAEGPAATALSVSVVPDEVLCLTFGVGEEEESEFGLASEAQPDDFIVAFEPRADGAFSLLRLHNLSGERVRVVVEAPGGESTGSEFPALGPNDEYHRWLPGVPRELVLRLDVGEPRVDPPAGDPNPAAPEQRAWPMRESRFEAGLRAGLSLEYALRPRTRVARFLARHGYEPFPIHTTRFGGAIGVNFERSFLELSLQVGQNSAPHATDRSRRLDIVEGNVLLEAGYELYRLGGLSIYPYGGLGLGVIQWTNGSSFRILIDNPPEEDFLVESFGGLVTAGIGLGQIVAGRKNGAGEEGLTMDFQLGVQQQIARTTWGFEASGEEGRQSLGRDPRLNLSAFVMSLTVGAAQRARRE